MIQYGLDYLNVTGIEAVVCADIADRQRKGIAKYGTTVEQSPLELRAWLTHMYEELTDAAIYARRAIEEQRLVPTRNANMIANKLMILRERTGLTQVEFARLCGINATTLRELECGKSLGLMKTWLGVVRATGCSLDWLISDKETE